MCMTGLPTTLTLCFCLRTICLCMQSCSVDTVGTATSYDVDGRPYFVQVGLYSTSMFTSLGLTCRLSVLATTHVSAGSNTDKSAMSCHPSATHHPLTCRTLAVLSPTAVRAERCCTVRRRCCFGVTEIGAWRFPYALFFVHALRSDPQFHADVAPACKLAFLSWTCCLSIRLVTVS